MDEKPLQDKDLVSDPRFRGDFRCVCLAERRERRGLQSTANDQEQALPNSTEESIEHVR